MKLKEKIKTADENWKDGEWKILLSSKKKFVKGMKGKEGRKEIIHTIITNDKLNLVLSEWTEVDNLEDSNLQIDDKFYKTFGGDKTYHRDYVSVIKAYLEGKTYNPKSDIKNALDVENMYKELIKEGSRLLNLDIK